MEVNRDGAFSGFSLAFITTDNTMHKLADVTGAYSQQRPLTILLA